METNFLSRRVKTEILVLLVLFVGALHLLIPTEPHTYHKIHIVLRKLYCLPPVLAAVWFGLRGAALTTFAVSVVFTIHAFLDWPGNYMEQANQVGELASFWVVGLLSGFLFDREKDLLQDVLKAHEETILALVSALDLRERQTGLHSQRVREYALLLGEKLGLAENVKRKIAVGALLHDIGKIAVPDHILLKPGSLTNAERSIMQIHPAAGHEIVSRFGFLREAAEIIRTHHEHYDGAGYPRGMKGAEIPLGARIFAVVDAYDALTSTRSYRLPLDHEGAMREINTGSGSCFDPAIVLAFSALDPRILEDVKRRYPG